MCIGYHLFDVACDKVFGHVDWYCPVVSFELFRLIGVTVAMVWLLACGWRSVMLHRQLGSRAVINVACSLCHMIFSLVNCIWIVFSFFPDKSVPV